MDGKRSNYKRLGARNWAGRRVDDLSDCYSATLGGAR